jgi:hypothetical protein
VWLDDMAAQMLQLLVQGRQNPNTADAVRRVASVWLNLGRHWPARSFTPQSALIHLQPSLLRLVAYITLQPLPAPAADTLQARALRTVASACMCNVLTWSGATMDWRWYATTHRWEAQAAEISSGSSSGSHQPIHPPDIGPGPLQTAAVLELEVRVWMLGS